MKTRWTAVSILTVAAISGCGTERLDGELADPGGSKKATSDADTAAMTSSGTGPSKSSSGDSPTNTSQGVSDGQAADPNVGSNTMAGALGAGDTGASADLELVGEPEAAPQINTQQSATGGASGADNTQAPASTAPDQPIANTNVSLGGSQDFGFFRAQLDNGTVPTMGSFDAAGFFAEHHTQLPPADCGNRVCLQAMLGVMNNLLNGANCTMLQLGLNSPIAADPGNRPPLQLAVVVDTSGSMLSDNKIDFVREGLGLLIDGLKDGDSFALVTYDTDAKVVFPMDGVEDNRVELRQLVTDLEANGSTNFYDGLEAGYREVFSNYDSGKQNRVILLSDGNPTAGETDSNTIVDMSKGFNSEGVGLTTVGLGTDFNIDLMRDLALQADGNFYFLENSGAVSEVFDEELSFFTVPIAFDLHLEVDAGSDYTFGRAVGSPLWEDTDNGGVLDVPSVFLAHRESASDITEDGGRRGGGSALLLELMPRDTVDENSDQTEADIATVNVQFREPGSDEVIKDTVFVKYPYAPSEVLDEGYFMNINSDNDDMSVVQKSFIMLNIFVGMENAVAAYYENDADPSESIGQLEGLLAAVRDYNEEIQDEDIEFDIALVQQLIDVMVANDIQPPEQLNIPDDPWPAD